MSKEVPKIEEDSSFDQLQKEIELEEISELEAPLKRIIEKLSVRIEDGEYSLIIGDDASGRIPAIILGNFVKRISEARGLVNPDIIFIPGKLDNGLQSFLDKILNRKNTSKQQEELDEYVSNQGAIKEKRILIITDTIQSGYSLKTLVDLLNRAGYNCDIATIGMETPIVGQGMKESLKGIDIFSGEYLNKSRKDNQNTPLIYREESRKFTGVYKKPGDKVSKTLKSLALPEGVNPEDVNPESINIYSSRREIQDSINQSRKDANIVVEHLIDWYESQKQEKE